MKIKYNDIRPTSTKSDQYTILVQLKLNTDADMLKVQWVFIVATEQDVADFYNQLYGGDMLSYRMFWNLVNSYIDTMFYDENPVYYITIENVVISYNSSLNRHAAIVSVSDSAASDYPRNYHIHREEEKESSNEQ